MAQMLVLDLGASVSVVNEKSPDNCPTFMPFSSPSPQKVLYNTEESQGIRNTWVKAGHLEVLSSTSSSNCGSWQLGTLNKIICCYSLH